MTAFQITQPATGVILGVFSGDTEEEAIDAMARDAGYNDAADMDEETGGDSSELQVDALPGHIELHNAFATHSAGSDGFAEHVETHCGYDVSRDEIKRISLAAAGSENSAPGAVFHIMWQNESWWSDDPDR